MKQRREDLEDLPLTFDGDTNGGEGFLSRAKLLGVVDSRNALRRGSSLVEVDESGSVGETEVLALRRGGAGEELVEDVVVALRFGLVDETRSLEEVGADAGADDGLSIVEEDL